MDKISTTQKIYEIWKLDQKQSNDVIRHHITCVKFLIKLLICSMKYENWFLLHSISVADGCSFVAGIKYCLHLNCCNKSIAFCFVTINIGCKLYCLQALLITNSTACNWNVNKAVNQIHWVDVNFNLVLNVEKIEFWIISQFLNT